MRTPVLTEAELAELEPLARSPRPGPWKAYIEGRYHTAGSHFVMTGTTDDHGPCPLFTPDAADEQDRWKPGSLRIT